MSKNIIIGLAFVGTFIAGMYFDKIFNPLIHTDGSVTTNTNMPVEDNGTTNETAKTNEVTGESIVITEPTTINSSQLSDGQKALLRTLGIDVDSLVVTPEMAACAEAKVGSARLAEITDGDTPSFQEGISLYSCYSN